MTKQPDTDMAKAEQAQIALRQGLDTARRIVTQTRRLMTENYRDRLG